MERLSLRPLGILPFLLVGMAHAKYFTPWAPLERNPDGGDKLLEESVYRLENGQWVMERQTGYGYDPLGSLIQASLYEKKPNQPEVRKSWEFSYTPDLVWSQVLRKGAADSGGLPEPIIGDVQEYRSGQQEIIQLTNEWHRDTLFGAQKSVVTLDAEGRETRRDYFHYSGGAWIHGSRNEIRRDASGRILREDWQFLTTGETISTIHEFDDQGRPTSITRTRQTQELRSYDGMGNLLTWEMRYWRNGAWARTARDVHAYDDQGARTETVEERILLGSLPSQDSRTTRKFRFERDTVNLIETRLEWYLDGSEWMPAVKSFFRINHDQDTLERIDSMRHQGAWKPQTRTLTEYDAERRPIGWLVSSHDGQGWAPYSRHRHVPAYNRHGQMVSARFERWQSGGDSVTGELTYAYDEKGYRTSYQIRERSASGREWGHWSTHKYLHPEGAGMAPLNREQRKAGPRVVYGRIAGPEGRVYDVRGRSLRGMRPAGIR